MFVVDGEFVFDYFLGFLYNAEYSVKAFPQYTYLSILILT